LRKIQVSFAEDTGYVRLFCGRYVRLFCGRYRFLLRKIRDMSGSFAEDMYGSFAEDTGFFCGRYGICKALLRKIQVLLPVDSEKQKSVVNNLDTCEQLEVSIRLFSCAILGSFAGDLGLCYSRR